MRTMTTKALLLAAGGALAAPAAAQIRSRTSPPRPGVHHVVRNSETPERYQIEPMIAGVALFDYDNDGRLDIFFLQRGDDSGAGEDDGSFSNRLYRNGPGSCSRTSRPVPASPAPGTRWGVAAGDTTTTVDRPLRDGGQPEHL